MIMIIKLIDFLVIFRIAMAMFQIEIQLIVMFEKIHRLILIKIEEVLYHLLEEVTVSMNDYIYNL